LVGDLADACSRRINIQHRLVCQVLDDIKTVNVIRMWIHSLSARTHRPLYAGNAIES
jgi:hypothetical protein